MNCCSNRLKTRRSELKLDCELQIARSASAQIGIPAAHVRSGRDWNRANAAAVSGGKRSVQKIYRETRQQRIAEVGVIEDVEKIDPPLHRNRFPQSSVLGHRKIELLEGWPGECVPAEIAEMLSARDTGAGSSVPGARDSESRGVQKVIRKLTPGRGIAHQIGAAEELVASIEVTFEEIIHVDGLSGLHAQNAVQSPA